MHTMAMQQLVIMLKNMTVKHLMQMYCQKMCRVTKLDNIRNERCRRTTKEGEIAKKVREGWLKWYGHVMRGALRRKEGEDN